MMFQPWLGFAVIMIIALTTPLSAQPQFEYSASSFGPVSVDPAVGIAGQGIEVEISIAEFSGATFDTRGFSMGLDADSSLIEVGLIRDAGVLAALNGGTGPDLLEVDIIDSGWTVSAIYTIIGIATIAFDTIPRPVIHVDYVGASGALIGLTGATSTPLTWTNTLGTPPTANICVVAGMSYFPSLSDGVIEFVEASSSPEFVRGDCNDDTQINLADAVFLLVELFSGGPTGLCADACDFNDDGNKNVADTVYLLNRLFVGGPEVPAPNSSTGCGSDPTSSDALDCAGGSICP